MVSRELTGSAWPSHVTVFCGHRSHRDGGTLFWGMKGTRPGRSVTRRLPGSGRRWALLALRNSCRDGAILIPCSYFQNCFYLENKYPEPGNQKSVTKCNETVDGNGPFNEYSSLRYSCRGALQAAYEAKKHPAGGVGGTNHRRPFAAGMALYAGTAIVPGASPAVH